MTVSRVASSFRDPSGFLFTRDGTLLRQVQPSYAPHYDALKASGLYDALVAQRLLVPHVEVPLSEAAAPGAAYVLRPERVPFVSLPYEWCLSQLRAAALLTLRVQQLALEHGMVLKDASAFNVQFRGTEPVFVDTLSFERRVEGDPWVAYRQFCQHFLGPLALQALVDPRLRELSRSYRLAPAPPRFASTSGRSAPPTLRRVSTKGIEGIVAHMRGAIEGLRWNGAKTEWGDYEEQLGYDADERSAKHDAVSALLRTLAPSLVIDLGANAGEYSRIAHEAGARVIAVDGDPSAVERAYARFAAAADPTAVLPLWIDLVNPSPSQGWAHAEWPALTDRTPADVVLALALIHHLAIGNNVPLPDVLGFLMRLGRRAVVEWVPKDDPQVKRLLSSRADIFTGYSEERFRAAAEARFRVASRTPVASTGRVLYLIEPKA
jgi:SAM-dependent methyltransferase